MVTFNVRADSLDEVGRMLHSVVVTFDANLEQVESVVNSVADATWQGQDADAFLLLWQGLKSTANEVRGHLTSLGLSLQSAGATYAGGESSSQQTFVAAQGPGATAAMAATSTATATIQETKA